MINKDKLKEAKKVLGYGYATDLAVKLKEKGILNSKGENITANYINQVFSGRIINIDIINIIIDDYKLQKRKLSKTINKLSKS